MRVIDLQMPTVYYYCIVNNTIDSIVYTIIGGLLFFQRNFPPIFAYIHFLREFIFPLFNQYNGHLLAMKKKSIFIGL